MPNPAAIKINERAAILMRHATYFSVTVAIIIIVMKFAAWLATDSLSLLSSLVDSVLDVMASMISLLAVRYALMPADEDHRFGHGKAEDIAAFSQSAFIAGSALFIAVEAFSRFLNPQKIAYEGVGIAVMAVSTVLTAALITYQRYVIIKTNSSAIKADSLHYQVDLLVNIIVIVALMLTSRLGWLVIDPIFALMIAGFILFSAYRVASQAFDNLMDKEFSDAEREKIIGAVLDHPEVKGIHDLRTRSSGIKPFIQFHLELDGSISLDEAHNISDAVEIQVEKLYPTAEVLIHQDPVGKEYVGVELGRAVSVHPDEKGEDI